MLEALKEAILNQGKVIHSGALSVDSFMNHQIDPILVDQIAQAFADHYQGQGITKVLTLEASGIAPALMTAVKLGTPMVFAKKTGTLKDPTGFYQTEVFSFSKQTNYQVFLSKDYLSPQDKVLIIDDFLANGEAALGLMDLVSQAGGQVIGLGICIEKSFQPGRDLLDQMGVPVYSLVRIQSLDEGQIRFVQG